MKFKNILGVASLAIAGMAFVACGGKDDGSKGGGGGAASIDDRVADLEAQIKALQDALKNAAESEIPALQAQLDDALAQLEALQTCANGGDCEGVESFSEISKITDAYCEWAFNCCSDDEVRATLSAAAGDVDGCKDYYSDILFRGNVTPYLPGAPFWEGQDQAAFADAIQSGRLEIDSDAVDACAEQFSGAACGGEGTAVRAECGADSGENACGMLFVGTKDLGESCSYVLTSEETIDTCKPGLHCSAYEVLQAGVCVEGASDGDPCQKDSDCADAEGTLYCDEKAGSCKVKPGEGDDCAFQDPLFNTLSPSNMEVPCLPGLWCSQETSTCMSECDSLEKGDLCYNNYECGESMFCDLGADADDLTYAGACADKLAHDAQLTSYTVASAQCISGSYYYDNVNLVYRCDGVGGEDCSDYGATECNSNSCDDTDKCRTKCDSTYGDSDCDSGEKCVNNVCYAPVSANQDCVVTEQCPATQYCDAGTCSNKLNAGDVCDDVDGECKEGTVCDYYGLGECVPVGGLAAGEDCYDWYHCSSQRCDTEDTGTCRAASALKDEGDACDMTGLSLTDINDDPCGAGLYCKLKAPNTSDLTGTCAAQGAPGDVCNSSQASTSRKVCEGNVSCKGSPATGINTCPVAYTAPGQDESCTLSVFSTYTGFYSNFL